MNNLEYATLFQTALDETIVVDLTSRGMEANASLVRYTGGNTCKIPKMSTDGLGDYSRKDGFPTGDITLEWETKTLTQDRGKEFTIDAMDNDETAFVASASNALGTFQKDHVVPEVDSYRFSKIFDEAVRGGAAFKRYTPAAADIYTKLTDDIDAIQDIIGENEPLVIYMSGKAYTALTHCTEWDKKIDIADFKAGDISTKVHSVNDVPIIKVPSLRMKTNYVFDAKNGYASADYAGQINWIIMARRAAVAVVKTDIIRIFDPQTNQKTHGWLIQMRKYHDCWLFDNKINTICVSLADETATATGATVASGKITTTVATLPGELYYRVGTSTAPTAFKLYDEFDTDGWTKIAADETTITASSGVYVELAVIKGGRVLEYDAQKVA